MYIHIFIFTYIYIYTMYVLHTLQLMRKILWLNWNWNRAVIQRMIAIKYWIINIIYYFIFSTGTFEEIINVFKKEK